MPWCGNNPFLLIIQASSFLQKLENNDEVRTSERRFVYVNPDGSIQDMDSPAAPCSGEITDFEKYIAMHEGVSASTKDHYSLCNGIAVWPNHWGSYSVDLSGSIVTICRLNMSYWLLLHCR